MKMKTIVTKVLAAVLTASLLPWPQDFMLVEEHLAAGQKEALPQAAYFWDFEDGHVNGTAVSSQGTEQGTASLHGATVQKAGISIEDKQYAGADNSVLSLAGGAKGSSYVKLPDNLYQGVSAESGLTWSFWMKPDSGVVRYSRIFSSIGSSNRGEFAYAPFADDKQWNLIFDDDQIFRQIYGKEPDKGVWSLITVTVSKEEAVFYINGDKCASNIIQGNTSLLAGKLNELPSLKTHALGMTTSRWSDPDCAATLDDVALYKTALTPVQVAELARSYGLEPQGPRVPQDAAEGTYGSGAAKKQLTQIPELTASSPDGANVVKVWKDSGDAYYYSVSRNGKVVIECSALGILTKDNDLTSGMALEAGSVSERAGTEAYEIIQGSFSKVEKDYTERSFTLTKGNGRVTVYFRVFGDGMAYRYEVDGDAASSAEVTVVTGEASEFVLPDKGEIWTVPVSQTYEGIEYTKRTMDSQYAAEAKYSTPILASLQEDSGNAWVLLTEANVYNEEDPYCGSVFQTEAGSKAFRTAFGLYLEQETDETKDQKRYSPTYSYVSEVPKKDVFHTPWRTAIIASDLEGIANSSLVTDLNPAPAKDFSWVEPGASVWSWWSTSYDAIQYKTMLDYIDFAAEAGMKYCLVDYGWELWDQYREKIASLVEYADTKDVSLLLWYGVNKFDGDHIFDLDSRDAIEAEFAWCEEVGVKGVKVDYINSASPFAMKVMYLLADLAADHHLVLNYHGCINPGGENRTYPNILSSEAVAGMENFKWNNGSSPATLLTLPFTRNVLGSMEFTPTGYKEFNSEATAGFMLANAVVYESALQTFAQSAFVYPGYHGFSLLSDVPTTWDESRLLEGYPGESVIRARRNGDDWYLGAMSLSAKTYQTPLDFLDPGTVYHACIYKDNAAGDNIEIDTRDVTSETVLELPIMENGGCSVKFSKTEQRKKTSYDDFHYYEAEDPAYAVLSGGARVSENQFASGLKHVGYVGQGGTLTFRKIPARADGEYTLRIYYISGEGRDLYLKVNDGEPIAMEGLVGNEKDWKAVCGISVPVNLNEGENTILFYNEAGNTPDIDRIAVSKLDLSGAQVKLSQGKYTYNGKECRPNVTVTSQGVELAEGKDYTVSYQDNVQVGTAQAVITGIGNCCGTAKASFVIEKAKEPPKPVTPQKKQAVIKGKAKYEKAYGAKAFSLQVSCAAAKGAKFSYVSDNTKVAKVSKNGKVTVKATGSAVITVKLVSDQYTAKPYKVKVMVKPSKVTLSSIKSKKKGQVAVTWKKLSSKQGISGYQIAYSTKKKFQSAKYAAGKKSAKSLTIKKLKSKKTYYVRIRAYKKVGKTKLYGAWSKAKRIKVK